LEKANLFRNVVLVDRKKVGTTAAPGTGWMSAGLAAKFSAQHDAWDVGVIAARCRPYHPPRTTRRRSCAGVDRVEIAAKFPAQHGAGAAPQQKY